MWERTYVRVRESVVRFVVWKLVKTSTVKTVFHFRILDMQSERERTRHTLIQNLAFEKYRKWFNLISLFLFLFSLFLCFYLSLDLLASASENSTHKTPQNSLSLSLSRLLSLFFPVVAFAYSLPLFLAFFLSLLFSRLSFFLSLSVSRSLSLLFASLSLS